MSGGLISEHKPLVAQLAGKQPDDIEGYVLVAITDGGHIVTSSAKNSGVIIYTLAEVIGELGDALSQGTDIQADAVSQANPEVAS